ncbi:conserved hypothetical protein [Flavobacterium sp. 9AF]|uniref:hypothetical protein n=1 Tax=Flavobacterium sp. 9AF TaxID=2653142 RepID=UPI0012EF8828|nr:hypothetical protein [Flavobacterium sp. 9AF]VXB85928.1 conserved hypothetical protein [Flavobacterium sp. 9AF]
MEEIDNIFGRESKKTQSEKQPYLYIHFDNHAYAFTIEANIEGLEILKNEIANTIVSCPKDIYEENSIFTLEKTKAITSSKLFLESIEIVEKNPPQKVNEENKKSSIELEVIGCLLVVALIGIVFIVGFITSIKYLIFQFL